MKHSLLMSFQGPLPALIWAITHWKREMVTTLLNSGEVDVNGVLEVNYELLLSICSNGNSDVKGRSPLTCAIDVADEKTVQELLQRGAMIESETTFGKV